MLAKYIKKYIIAANNNNLIKHYEVTEKVYFRRLLCVEGRSF